MQGWGKGTRKVNPLGRAGGALRGLIHIWGNSGPQRGRARFEVTCEVLSPHLGAVVRALMGELTTQTDKPLDQGQTQPGLMKSKLSSK
jgi:hypothetical protein